MLPDSPLVPVSRAHTSRFRSIPVLSWVALVVSLAATVLGWHLADRQVAVQTQLRVAHEIDYGIAKLRERLLLCESVVHGAQGLYAASRSVERREWKVYGQGLFAEKQYPGVRALLSIAFVPHTNLDTFLNITRGDEAPDFAIAPPGTRHEYCPIKFIQSKSSEAYLLGKDVSLIPELLDSLMAARDSASFTLTTTVRLTASVDEPPEVMLILPVYRNDAPRSSVAEVATGVLHNVGNVLNSVNVSAALVVDQLRESKTVSLARVVRLLREHQGDLGGFLSTDPKGKQIPAFLEAVSEELAREQSLLMSETERLQKNIEHIKHIVSMQQSYARVSGIIENLDPKELVENALHMSSSALARHQVEVVRQFDEVPPVRADRHLALQILVNLINNAKEALDQRPEGRRLTLRILSATAGQVQFEVSDNGSGIEPANLTRIFQHGFTTKRNGHGFGLHSGANAAKEMGGSLSARSDGTGTGAIFCLELPAGVARNQTSEGSATALRDAA